MTLGIESTIVLNPVMKHAHVHHVDSHLVEIHLVGIRRVETRHVEIHHVGIRHVGIRLNRNRPVRTGMIGVALGIHQVGLL